jgi:predicted kinase
MARVILICGKICSGKTTYAQKLRRQRGGVILSVDEIMLALFGQHCGDRHDEYAAKTREYLCKKSVELTESGIDVILDWGFWTRAGREEMRAFFAERKIFCEFHCLVIPDDLWRARLEKRNAEVLLDPSLAYFVDENLAAKFEQRFEMPDPDEIDVWIRE